MKNACFCEKSVKKVSFCEKCEFFHFFCACRCIKIYSGIQPGKCENAQNVSFSSKNVSFLCFLRKNVKNAKFCVYKFHKINKFVHFLHWGLFRHFSKKHENTHFSWNFVKNVIFCNFSLFLRFLKIFKKCEKTRKTSKTAKNSYFRCF